MEMIEELDEIVSNPFNSAVKTWKEGGKKIIGTVCCYVPEEIIYAAGMIPYRIRATGCRKHVRADVLMSSFSCTFCRACLEFALDGTYDFLDGVAASDSCGQVQRLYDNLRFRATRPFMHSMTVPRKGGESAFVWYRDELINFKEKIENFFGVKTTEESLKDAIRVYNETRRLLRELYELRKSDVPPLTGLESQKLVLAAMSMPRDRYNTLLVRYLEKKRNSEPVTKEYRARLMVIGSALDDPALTKVIEDQGGVVVTDVLCFGSRYFWEPLRMEGDALSSLARSYLNRVGCPRMMDQHQRLFEFIKDMAQEFRVDGIIFERIQYCDLWGGESLFMEDKFKDANIPVLTLQREEVMANVSQIAVRVEAFMEMIGEEI